MAAVVKTLTGTINGSNTDFTTPEEFVAGSFRPIINGIVYEVDDDDWGCTEIDTETIRLNTAPETGYSVQGFYVQADVTGSPFDPGGSFP